jgi:hypothetical protein
MALARALLLHGSRAFARGADGVLGAAATATNAVLGCGATARSSSSLGYSARAGAAAALAPSAAAAAAAAPLPGRRPRAAAGPFGTNGGAPALGGSPAPRRSMGIMDRLSAFVSRGAATAEDSKKEEAFKWQMEFMLGQPRYSLTEHFALLESLAARSGATGWRKMLLTDAQKSELEEHLVDLKLADLLTPAEKADPRGLVGGAARARLAAQLGVAAARVNRFMAAYEQAEAVHGWLLARRAAGKGLPSTMEEYSHTMLADRVGFSKEAQKKQARKTKHQQSLLRKV